MKKLFTLLAFATLLTGCAFGSSTSQNSEKSVSDNPGSTSDVTSLTPSDSTSDTSTVTPDPIVDLDQLKEQYGEFSITTEKGDEPILSSDGKIYTITVSAAKSAYTISGYFEGQIVINNENELDSYKGVELTLSNACLVYNSGSTIDYQVDGKNVEVKAKKNTENYIINLSEVSSDSAINSGKNIEVDGKGILNIITESSHGLKADDTIRFYDAPTINITSGHDAIHAAKFVSNNEEVAEDLEEFTGTLNVLSALSQAFDCTTSKGKGKITLLTGIYNINNCESAFKTDVSLTIGSTVVVSNLTSDPVVRGDNSTGVTIEITETGSFTVDGVDYTETNI
ncbi:MAG: hypothetical protein J1F32_06535 [Erysipelotrichales bacterium]|nr:hypothetical protein [Erysipelotrichales bacterium]